MPLQTVSADDWNTSLSDKTTVIGIGDDTYWVQNANKSWSISSTDGNIVRFEVRQDDVWYNDSLNKNRSELSSRTLIADGTEVDISYQFQLAPGAANTADWFVIGQLHQDDYVGAPAYSPPFGIYLDGEHMVIQVNYVDASGKQAFLKLYTDPNNIERGHYYDMDITVTFYDNNTGDLVVVRDGVTVVDYTGPMGFTTQSSVYWKEGIYRSSDATETVVAYFKDLEITTSAVSIPTDPDPDPVNFTGTTGDDTLNGTSANDELRGLAGNDLLNGGAGADQMYGGPGNDTYVVDNSGDQVTEYSGEGTDTVNSTVSYTLNANVENLVLLGSAAINGVGNALANTIYGNDAANVLNGNDGNDTLRGLGGNDTLDGGAGVDQLYGGTGDDTYIVDNVGDVIYENAGEGTDQVNATVTYRLAGNVENLTLLGSAAINGTGNELDNTLIGNDAVNALSGYGGDDLLYGRGGADVIYGGDGDDLLDGGSGADLMYGGAGNDTYVVDDAKDSAIESAGQGTDTVRASVSFTLAVNVENLTLTGASAINGTGNTLANVIVGNGADNILTGGRGTDTLTGGEGADRFVFTALSDFGPMSARDTITDFSAAQGDRIDLSQIDANTTVGGNQDFTFLGTAAFTGHAGELRETAVAGGYLVSGDLNGDGVSDFQLMVNTSAALHADSFFL